MTVARHAIIGAGISGLVAAYRLRQRLGEDAVIDVYEATDRAGGVLRTTEVGGNRVDVGAEAFIVRRPEALALVRELGLAAYVAHPTGRRPAIWARGRLHPLPTPALMGIPAGVEAVAGLVDDADLARIADEADRPFAWTPGTEPSVGELVGDRFGPSVLTRSVDPMLGGVYSSLAGDIGLREAVPALAARLDAGAASLSGAVRDVLRSGGGSGPVFGTLTGGYRLLVDALLAAGSPNLLRDMPVEAVIGDGGRWVLRTAADGRAYDGVIVAVPAWTAGALLREAAPEAATLLRAVEPASSAVVSIALAPRTPLPDHSGVLVATGEGLRAKAFTFSAQKWPHLAGDGRAVSVRVSFGRYGDPVPAPEHAPDIDDRLRAHALADLDEVRAAAGIAAPSRDVVDAVVQHWTGGLPRYAPGHLVRMTRVGAALPAGLAVAGSSYAGVGVPACIGQAGRAAARLLGVRGE
ncbi:MAG: FAD-dependent oxidoreductase [Gordonia sp. (in: high G+C Gram-positive bacteria)]